MRNELSDHWLPRAPITSKCPIDLDFYDGVSLDTKRTQLNAWT